MIDINFYMNANEVKQRLEAGLLRDKSQTLVELERCRNMSPVVFNIETTNACNMKCKMCPRTTQMTRAIKTLDMETYEKVVDQIRPFTDDKWALWEKFAQRNYRISKNGMSENHFFLYVISRVIILHGYGEPLLDRHISQRVKLLTERNIPSYFSCNPANIDIDKTLDIFKSGLSYIKYSIDSIDDKRHREVRGALSNFSESYKKILTLLEMKRKYKFKTVIVITMIDLDNSWQKDDYLKLIEAFRGRDVYIYIKSADQKWYTNDYKETKSIHWSEFCQFPWSSMTIMSNGQVTSCGQDYNNELTVGDATLSSLNDIWNGEAYRSLRKNHIYLDEDNKCTTRCDMRLAGRFVQ